MLARVLSLVVSCVLAGSAAGGGLEEATRRSKPTSSEAYVTLVYGDDFVLGARVLGQSLRETGTARYAVLSSDFARTISCIQMRA